MESKSEIRRQVWQRLRQVARPDSRFHWDFGEFIPDYEGSEHCAAAIRQMDAYRHSQMIFITPDNNLLTLREYAIRDNKTVLITTYGIARGFMMVERQDVPEDQERYAASLDGLEEYARFIDLNVLSQLGKVDLLITGASLISTQGIRWGKGHGYFDLEWAMLRELGLVGEETPIIAVVHDCQVTEVALTPDPYDTIVDYIVTPASITQLNRTLSKPDGILWNKLDPATIKKIPPLEELYRRKTSGKIEP
jgi:5-formyltetrahydrofolate cyclo-ligase